MYIFSLGEEERCTSVHFIEGRGKIIYKSGKGLYDKIVVYHVSHIKHFITINLKIYKGVRGSIDIKKLGSWSMKFNKFLDKKLNIVKGFPFNVRIKGLV